MSKTHVVLVALEVEAETMAQAQDLLIHRLPVPGLGPVQSWWIAEDERYDGSDNDSAVFVPMGRQSDAGYRVDDLYRVDADTVADRNTSRLTDDEPHCPACGQPIQYCSGHGSIGDSWGFATLEAHDNGDHSTCDPRGCENAGEGLEEA